jgi:hypothetical protein
MSQSTHPENKTNAGLIVHFFGSPSVYELPIHTGEKFEVFLCFCGAITENGP